MTDPRYIGAPWTRKAETWATLTGPCTTPAVLAYAATLPTFPAAPSPMSYFGEARPQYFVASCADGQRFLVNTEGYEYARYIVALGPVPAAGN